MKERKRLLKKGDVVLVRLAERVIRATVVRDESSGRPVVLRTETGQLMTAFPDSITTEAR
jgi:hypothetical protein